MQPAVKTPDHLIPLESKRFVFKCGKKNTKMLRSRSAAHEPEKKNPTSQKANQQSGAQGDLHSVTVVGATPFATCSATHSWTRSTMTSSSRPWMGHRARRALGGGGLVTGELQLLGWPLPGRWTLPFTADDALGGRHTRTTGGKRKQGIREEGAGPLKLWAHRTNGPAHSFAKTESPALEKNSKKNKNNATSCAAFGKKKMNNAKKNVRAREEEYDGNAERTVQAY